MESNNWEERLIKQFTIVMQPEWIADNIPTKWFLEIIGEELDKAREFGRKSVFGLSQDETVLLTMGELDEIRTKFREEGRQEATALKIQLAFEEGKTFANQRIIQLIDDY